MQPDRRSLGQEPIPGAGEGNRTPDPLITNQVLYQLSYASLIPSRRTGQTLKVA
jgi:hypothetical protein